jgi:hypothetical protein
MSGVAEVLEIGEDGSFDTSAGSTVQKKETQPLDYSTFDWSAILREDNIEIVEKLNPGEYAIYETEKGKVWVIVKLENDGECELYSKGNTLQLRTGDKKMEISLPSNLSTTGKTLTSKQWNGYVTLLIE